MLKSSNLVRQHGFTGLVAIAFLKTYSGFQKKETYYGTQYLVLSSTSFLFSEIPNQCYHFHAAASGRVISISQSAAPMNTIQAHVLECPFRVLFRPLLRLCWPESWQGVVSWADNC